MLLAPFRRSASLGRHAKTGRKPGDRDKRNWRSASISRAEPETHVRTSSGETRADCDAENASTVKALNGKRSATPFSHGATAELGKFRLFSSYHCSRYNTNTGVLTPKMFRAVFAAVRKHLDR